MTGQTVFLVLNLLQYLR